MSKIISVFGKSGTGKTTLVVNLACGLAERQFVVAIVSAELNHGSIQVPFGVIVPEGQGIFAAMNDKTEQPQGKLTQIKQNENIYLLTVPNAREDIFYENLEQKTVEDLLRRIGVHVDFILIDCTPDLNNPITLMALNLSSTVFCTYRATIETCLWHQSMRVFFQQFGLSPVSVISEYNIGCSIQEFLKTTGLDPVAILPEVENATLFENVGRPIYSEKDKQSRKYRAEIDKIADTLIG
ncbi:MAG: AAA family ATPase [Eubacteriales bacterium]|nr:AAA family ATPase [Eubacteriales bacterium]